jgi:hypothetical protein
VPNCERMIGGGRTLSLPAIIRSETGIEWLAFLFHIARPTQEHHGRRALRAGLAPASLHNSFVRLGPLCRAHWQGSSDIPPGASESDRGCKYLSEFAGRLSTRCMVLATSIFRSSHLRGERRDRLDGNPEAHPRSNGCGHHRTDDDLSA